MLLAETASLITDAFLAGLLGSVVFGGVGILLLIFGFFMFDWVCRKIDFQKELVDNKNIAVAIVIGSFLLAVAYIIAHVVK